ncbi:MAG: MBL fold metallo-hydrolase RNA specificity domain-containing protein [Saccharofermentanales bacterium]|jgi:metallo-beta-lactamase family protein
MKITFYGATEDVTGSNFMVTTEHGERFLIDCGMFQGSASEEARNRLDFPYDISQLDFLILTHAHLDHSGRIPKLVKEGFNKPIYTTQATMELVDIMLQDSAQIQYFDIQWENKKRQRAGEELLEPLYGSDDVVAAMELFEPHYYEEMVDLTPNIRMRLRDAGHILGSAIVELWITEHDKTTKVVFSGDLGMHDHLLIRDPSSIEAADLVILESTYGNTVHAKYQDSLDQLMQVIYKTINRGGSVIVPSFAIGRTQELLYEMNKYFEYGGHGQQYPVPIYVDSPMATKATSVFMRHTDLLGEEAQALVRRGDNIFNFPNLTYTRSVDESKVLNEMREPKVIISASGMATGGRVRHHLKYNLWDPLSAVIFVGYQAAGTLGRIILDGTTDKVKIAGSWVDIRASVYSMPGFSAHADKPTLLNWLADFETKPKQVVLVHGETREMLPLKDNIEQTFGIDVMIPRSGDELEFLGDETCYSTSILVSAPDLYEVSKMMDEVGRMMGSWEDQPPDLHEMSDEQLSALKSTLAQIKKNMLDLNMITYD